MTQTQPQEIDLPRVLSASAAGRGVRTQRQTQLPASTKRTRFFQNIAAAADAGSCGNQTNSTIIAQDKQLNGQTTKSDHVRFIKYLDYNELIDINLTQERLRRDSVIIARGRRALTE
ncbi:hypothetical protein YC2023_040296 [Brassica napus]